MGNKLSRRRRLVEERYTRPQGLYPIKDFDQKKLRKLILDAKLAPCYPGGEEQAVDLDECPICFLYYPSLNRSRCCMKGICTECFLQMKPPNSSRPTQCPFCKTPNYCVEYRGVKTQEEKIIEQVEEQKVIEAKIKIQQQEHKEENERIHKKQEFLHTGQVSPSQDIDYQHHQHLNAVSDSRIQTINPSSPVQNEIRPLLDGDASANVTRASSSGPVEDQLHHRSSGKMLTWSQPLPSRHNRDDDFDLDLEDIMVMEAIWQSIHESGVQRFTGSSSRVDYGSRPGPSSGLADCQEANAPPSEMSTSRDVGPNNSVTGGLACAIAALAERQVLNGDSSNRQNAGSQQNQSNLGECDSLLEDTHHNHTIDPQGLTSTVHAVNENRRTEEEQQSCLEERNDGTDSDCGERAAEFHTPDNWIEVSLESGRALSPRGREGSQGSTSDWAADQSSEVVEVGTSFSSSIRSTSDMPWTSEAPQGAENSVDPSPFNAQSYVVPESYEEQIMLALAISLAEAQAQSC